MPDETDSLPPKLEAELALLLDHPAEAFDAAIAKLCRENSSFAGAIRAWASAIHLFRGRDEPSSTGEPTALQQLHEGGVRPGERVGPFVILSEIGSGGMGEVYLAEQREPVQRRVALKVIKLGMDSKAMLARFEVERQALAMMDHAAIAKVFEAGITAQGRSYFAMEYVKGVAINTYCNENRLSVEDRLALFRQVCSGVQHAHQKGVIHRDLTPANVLVTAQDGKPSPKIIDFGLARATNQRLTERTLFTVQGMILGTPEYMSPEQAGLSGLDVDMRTDVYALGVLLYELLTSKLPFERQALRDVGYDAMCRTIREQDPPRPSTKITEIAGDSNLAAKQRRTSSETLLKRLRGDLDWIVMKCLEKDRTRRYETVSELAADVQRHLDCEPVLARAPSVRYRVGKFAQRHRGHLVAVGLVLVAVFGGLAGTTTFWLDARAQAGAAELARQGEAAKAKEAVAAREGEAVKAREAVAAREGEAAKAKEAVEQAELARAVVKFLREDLFGAVDSDNAKARAITVREVLDEAAPRLDNAFGAQPAVAAELRRLIGDIYARLGEFKKAKQLLHDAVAAQRILARGRANEGLATALSSLAMYHGHWAKDNVARGVEVMQEAIAVYSETPQAVNEVLQSWKLQLEAMRAHASGQSAAGLTPVVLAVLAQLRGKQETPEQVLAFVSVFKNDLEKLLRAGQREPASVRFRQELAPFLRGPARIRGEVAWGIASYAVSEFSNLHQEFWLFVASEAAAIARETLSVEDRRAIACERLHCTLQLYVGQLEPARRMSRESFRLARDNLGNENSETCRLAELVIEIEHAAPDPDADSLAEAASLLELHVGTATGTYDQEALVCLQRAIPRAAVVLTEAALAALARDGMQLDHYARAGALAAQAKRLSASPQARQFDALALASSRLGKHDEAISLAKQAIELAKSDAERTAFAERLRLCEEAARAR